MSTVTERGCYKHLVVRANVFLVAAAFIASLVSVWPSAAYATTTAAQCDSVPKYYCTYISYSVNGSVRNVNARYWKGAIDGGAYHWRLDYAIDYYWNGSSYSRGYDATGPSSYQTNVYLGSYTCGSCVSYGYTTSGIMVAMLIRFDECVNNVCNTWYGGPMYHYG